MDKNQNAETNTVAANSKPTYTREQLSEGYKAFGTTRAIVDCALRLTGKESFTMDEARKIVEIFRKKR